MKPRQELSLVMLQLLLEASQKGAAVTMPLNSVMVRVKRGRKVGVRDGEYAHEVGKVLFAVPDEAVLNLKGPEEARDLWLLSRIKRQVADDLMVEKPKIERPHLVGQDGKPLR